MPTKLLPDNPSLDHLKHQAKDLQRARQARELAALQRIREFHPRFPKATDVEIGDAKFTLTDAMLTIAREHGFKSWARLKLHVEKHETPNSDIPLQDRITDPIFRKGVDLLDSGDVGGLQAHLAAHPDLVHQRVLFEGGNYFTHPSLLEFAAENPIRNNRLPANIVEVVKVILEAGAKRDIGSMGYTLSLVCSGKVPRECKVQVPLIDLLCDYGVNPSESLQPAAIHGEFEAVGALLRRGAKMDLPTAAALGQVEPFKALLSKASGQDKHMALAQATQHGRSEIVRILLEAGEDPSRYNPLGAHAHSTPLHQAALSGEMKVVRLLVEYGARLDLKDILFHSTPLGWAEYAGKIEVVKYLRSCSGSSKES